ncbi:MAG: VWA domain-containing protein [Gracilimonas sp.]|uniref:VWA domain-containing protein n=1 Tax=Gracilimonas sp. TaxID=1974203 RepID=UPI0019C230F4|nr:VWA domain-containing protein [Gracilimonas sp.]MBD3615000.1 VWA domain-containing protein [Gracilimonas sp.]
MIWENSLYLWLLTLIPAGIVLLWWKSRQVRAIQKKYFSTELFSSLRKGFWPLGNRLKTISMLAGLFFLIVALAGPKIGTEVREIKRQGIDMLVALDLSASMNAEDVRPSRLEKAKFEINRLIERLRGDRVGLVVFTGEAYLQSPMTLDYSALRLFLDIADTEQMPSSATDFKSAMETAMDAFEALEDNGTDAAKVLLIISDGEDHGQSYDEALEALISENILVYTLGVGTAEGTTIPIYEEGTDRLIGYKRDNSGRVVTTKLQSQTLRSIAGKGNGEYYSIERGNDGIDSFLARMDDLEKGEFASQEYADYKNQYQWMGVLALLCFVVSVLIPSYKE